MTATRLSTGSIKLEGQKGLNAKVPALIIPKA
jgi:hypothetical protein